MAQRTTKLAQRTLGGQGLKAGAIGLGTMGMTIACGAPDEQSSTATVHRAHELGVTPFDTAELYGLGTGSNEQLLGRAVQDFRDRLRWRAWTRNGTNGHAPSGFGQDSCPSFG